MVVKGKEYRERREAGQELIKVARLLNEKARSSRKEVQKAAGGYAGFPLSIHASGMWDNHFAEVYAQGKHYAYGADVRIDSDPVAFIRPCIIRYTRAWRVSWPPVRKCSQAGNPQGQDLRRWQRAYSQRLPSSSRRKRGTKEVVEAIKEHNEKHVGRAEEYSLDWEAVDGLTAEKVAQEVERLVSGASTVIVSEHREESVHSWSQIRAGRRLFTPLNCRKSCSTASTRSCAVGSSPHRRPSK